MKKYWLVKRECYYKLPELSDGYFSDFTIAFFTKKYSGVYISYEESESGYEWGHMPYPSYNSENRINEPPIITLSTDWYKYRKFEFCGEYSIKNDRKQKIKKICSKKAIE